MLTVARTPAPDEEHYAEFQRLRGVRGAAFDFDQPTKGEHPEVRQPELPQLGIFNRPAGTFARPG